MLILTPDARYRFHARDEDSNFVSEPAMVKECWVENVYQVHQSHFDDSGVCFDIGANIGEFAIYAASLGAKVFAVEPNVNNLEYLMRNIEENKLTEQITVLNVAVSDYTGTGYITDWRGNSRLYPDQEEKELQQVEVVTLRDLYAMTEVPYVDVLKIDVEGVEDQLIVGADLQTLCKARYLALEFETMSEERFGRMMYRICSGFNTHVLGIPQRGGYVYGNRYDGLDYELTT